MSETSDPSVFSRAWMELRRRKVVRAGITYALVAWVVLQLGEITFEPLGLPPQALTWTILLAILGLPIVLVLAWFFDLGPGGLTRDRSPAARVGAVLLVALVLLTVAAVGSWLSNIYQPPQAVAETTPTNANSIAVLPFTDMSPAGDQSYLGDGIAEELLDRLARIHELQVAARTSSFALRDKAGDIREVGRLLQVRWVVEGSLRKAGHRLRITAQLIDAGSGFHRWSKTYEGDDSDLFALQDEVSTAIAAQLREHLQLPLAETAAVRPQDSTVAAAHEAFLRGRQAWRLRSPASLAEAERLFQQAVELDPGYARAWAGLADTFLLQAEYGERDAGDAIQRAEPAAVRAVTLAPTLGEAWASLGLLRMTAGQLAAAERSFREAMRLDPRYEMAPMWLAGLLGRRGDAQAQLEVLRQAQQLNPLEPVINSNLARALAELGQPEAADALLQRLLAVTPNDALVLRSLAEIRAERGALAEALGFARAALVQDPAAPVNQLTLLRILLLLQAFEQADGVLESALGGAEFRLQLRQWRVLYSGQPHWLPELRQQLQGKSPAELALQRPLLLLSTWAAAAEEADAIIALLAPLLSDASAADEDLELRSLWAALHAKGQPLSANERARWAEHAAHWQAGAQVAAPGHYLLAALHALAGEHAQALTALQRAAAGGFIDLAQLRLDPRLAALRREPAFIELQQSLQARINQQRLQAGLPPSG